jgi:hypothetical protein
MKSMTKRDIADIVLVCIIVSFFKDLFTYVMSLGALLALANEEFYPETIKYQTIFQSVIAIIVCIFIIWFLVSKRKALIDFFFPDAEIKGVILNEEFTNITGYSFWIRLIGIFFLLSSTIKGFSYIVRLVFYFLQKSDAIVRKTIEMDDYTYGLNGLISIILSILIIWKADWIGDVLGRLGKRQLDKKAGHPDET